MIVEAVAFVVGQQFVGGDVLLFGDLFGQALN